MTTRSYRLSLEILQAPFARCLSISELLWRVIIVVKRPAHCQSYIIEYYAFSIMQICTRVPSSLGRWKSTAHFSINRTVLLASRISYFFILALLAQSCAKQGIFHANTIATFFKSRKSSSMNNTYFARVQRIIRCSAGVC